MFITSCSDALLQLPKKQSRLKKKCCVAAEDFLRTCMPETEHKIEAERLKLWFMTSRQKEMLAAISESAVQRRICTSRRAHPDIKNEADYVSHLSDIKGVCSRKVLKLSHNDRQDIRSYSVIISVFRQYGCSCCTLSANNNVISRAYKLLFTC